MYLLSLKDLQALSGLSATILRIWEGRHDLLTPVAPRQKIRSYTDENLKRLLQLAILYQNGWKTTELATLSEKEITETIDGIAEKKQKGSSPIQSLLLAAIALNEKAFVKAFDKTVNDFGFEQAITTISHAFLARLRLLTPIEVISAKEHFSVYLLRSRLIAETERIPVADPLSPRLALITLTTAVNELPSLHLNFLLRKAGCNVLFLGDAKKLSSVVKATTNTALSYLWVHVGGEQLPLSTDDYLLAVRQAFPSQTIIVSGTTVQSNQRRFVNMHLLSSDAEIDSFIKSYPFGTT